MIITLRAGLEGETPHHHGEVEEGPAAEAKRVGGQPRLGVNVKVIQTPACTFLIENHE